MSGIRFDDRSHLENFLGGLDHDYRRYTEPLWTNDIRRPEQLANADVQDYVSCGISNTFHIKDIKARAGAGSLPLCVLGEGWHGW